MELIRVTIQGSVEHVSVKALFTGKLLQFNCVYLMLIDNFVDFFKK
jgi:hypothetical protein